MEEEQEAAKGSGYSFKIVVLGEPGVGKTSILRIWSNEDVPDPPPAPAPTATFEFGHRLFKSAEFQRCYQIEESMEVHFLERRRDIEKVEKWQLEEEIKEKGVPPELFPVDQMDTLSAFYDSIAAAFIVFSIPDQKNLDELKRWIAEITTHNKNPDLWITIIGNKRD